MRDIWDKVGPPLGTTGLFYLVTGREITWMTVIAFLAGTATWHILAPLVTVIYKNIRRQPYIPEGEKSNEQRS